MTRRAGRGWAGLLLLCAGLAAPTAVDPQNRVAAVGHAAALVIVAWALLVSLRRRPATDATSWSWIVAGTSSGVAGSLLWLSPVVLPTVHGVGLQDLLWLAVYPLTVRGVLLLIRQQDPGTDGRRALVLDTVVVTSAAAVVAWHLLIWPSIGQAGSSDGSADLVATVVAVLYPLGDVVTFALAAALLIASAKRGASEVLLVAALAAELPLDVAHAVVVTAAPDAGDGWYRFGYVVINGMLAAAALHPRDPDADTADGAGWTTSAPSLHGWRIVLLGAALSGVALSALVLPEKGLARLPVAAALVVALAAILARVDRAVHALESAERRLQHQVTHDHLTGAASRAVLFDALSDAVRRTTPVVIVIDLDGFKQVNDTLGHHAGDQVLVGVVDRLTRLVRSGDLVARTGGDEFVVVCHDLSPDDAERVARRIGEAVRVPVVIDGKPVAVGASVGVLIPSRTDDVRQDGADPDAVVARLLAAADAAMYEAKRTGAGVAVVHDSLIA